MWKMMRHAEPLLPLSDALDALGNDGDMGRYGDEVSLDSIVGSAARPDDFDAEWRPRRSMPRLADVRRRFDEGSFPPPLGLCGSATCTSCSTGTTGSWSRASDAGPRSPPAYAGSARWPTPGPA